MGANEKHEATHHGGENTPCGIERRIKSEVSHVVANVSNWPDPIASRMLGRDLAEPIDKIVEALLPLFQEAKAEAWDEGFFDGRRQDAEGDDGPRFVNPYK